MKIEAFDTDEHVFVVAEIGNNHEGVFALAQEMIGRAAEAGVDAVKFQTFVPDLFVSKDDLDRMERMRRFQLDFSQFEELAQQAQLAGVMFFSTPLDLESAHFLQHLQPLFKIASGDNNFFPLIETIGSFGKPTIISTGLADIDLLDRVHRRWNQQANPSELAYLHCVACYPVRQDQANLAAVHTLRSHFPDVTVGYSDHTLGNEAALYAVAAGARIIEKHFTLDKHHSDFRDHRLSADPEEMKNLVAEIRRVELIMGSGAKAPQECEVASETAMRRSIAVVRDLPADHELAFEDLCWVRPGSGIVAGRERDVLGRRTQRSLSKGDFIRSEDLD